MTVEHHGHTLRILDPESGDVGCVDCGAEPRHSDWSTTCPAEQHRLDRRSTCPGSGRVPTSHVDGHAVCDWCHRPMLLASMRLPEHRGSL